MDSAAHTLRIKAASAARQAGELLRAAWRLPANDELALVQAVDARLRSLLCQEGDSYRSPYTHTGTGAGPIWLVDPLNDRAGFAQRRRGSAISIARLDEGQLTGATVFAFNYPDDRGDLLEWAAGSTCLLRNDEVVPPAVPLGFLLVPPCADDDPLLTRHLAAPLRYVTRPSIAYRLALAAAGDGDAALALAPCTDCSLAAGQALLHAVGKQLVDEHGQEVHRRWEAQTFTRCFGGSAEAVEKLRTRSWAQLATREIAFPFADDQTPWQPRLACHEAVLLDRAQGCLLGQLAGDTLGGLVEFSSGARIRERNPEGVRRMQDGGTWSNLAGQPTDDSEMALTLARLLVKHGRYEPGAALEAYCGWWEHAWDRGRTLGCALNGARAGHSTAERLQLAARAADTESQANGSLMRLSPLGIFGAGQPKRVAEWARQDSMLTHPHPVCADSCAVYATAVARAIADRLSPAGCFAAALSTADQLNVQPTVRQALLAARIGRPVDYQSQMGWVLIALQNAFYQLLHAESVEDGIADTIAQGGDTDTTAAIAGALLGAVHGRAQMPRAWLLTLQACRPTADAPTRHPTLPRYWPTDALELAEMLLAAGQQNPL